MRGKKYNDDVREKIRAMLAANNNIAYVSKKSGVCLSTVKTWKKEFENVKPGEDSLAELRLKKKAEFVERAWQNIELANKVLERKLERAYKQEDAIDKLIEKSEDKNAATIALTKLDDLTKLSTTIGTLYDKSALANNEATERSEVNVSIESYLKKVEGKPGEEW